MNDEIEQNRQILYRIKERSFECALLCRFRRNASIGCCALNLVLGFINRGPGWWGVFYPSLNAFAALLSLWVVLKNNHILKWHRQIWRLSDSALRALNESRFDDYFAIMDQLQCEVES